MFRELSFLLITCLLVGCSKDNSGPTREQVCSDFCEQKEECQLLWLGQGFSDVETCVDACVNNELPSDCTEGISEECLDARFARWACVAGLSCGELQEYRFDSEVIKWELASRNEDGEWVVGGDSDYTCGKRDMNVSEACSEVDWNIFTDECGYDGNSWANYQDLEFDDF